MPITLLKKGEKGRVREIQGNDDVRHRLQELGLVEGVEVEVIFSQGGKMILGFYGTRLAIDDKVASRIIVHK
ncbi:ferrous iron transport protein A [bacterium]|nr:ferrous iron transport protein A [bacterium]MBR5900793.1 ferrous iron transport protein A [bacterium]